MFYSNSNQSRRGFTLLEMIVSFGIFAVVAVIAVGSLVRITGLNKRAQALQSAMNNVNFTLETMSREMRQGSNYHCDKGNSGTWIHNASASLVSKDGKDCSVIAFYFFRTEIGSAPTPPDCKLVYAYALFDSVLKKARQKSCLDDISTDDFYPVLDEENVILTVGGTEETQLSVDQSSGGYSLATIRLVGHAGKTEKDYSYFDVQTSVSNRLEDI